MSKLLFYSSAIHKGLARSDQVGLLQDIILHLITSKLANANEDDFSKWLQVIERIYHLACYGTSVCEKGELLAFLLSLS